MAVACCPITVCVQRHNRRQHWEPHYKFAALTETVTPGFDPLAHYLDELPHEGETYAQLAWRTVKSALRLGKESEDMRQQSSGQPLAPSCIRRMTAPSYRGLSRKGI